MAAIPCRRCRRLEKPRMAAFSLDSSPRARRADRRSAGKPHDDRFSSALSSSTNRAPVRLCRYRPAAHRSHRRSQNTPDPALDDRCADFSRAEGTPHPRLHAYAQMGDCFSRSGSAGRFPLRPADYLANVAARNSAQSARRRERSFSTTSRLSRTRWRFMLPWRCAPICFWFAP